MGKDRGNTQDFFEQGRTAGKFAYELTFKRFEIFLTEFPIVFRIDEYIKKNL
jgi:hypothetical protein